MALAFEASAHVASYYAPPTGTTPAANTRTDAHDRRTGPAAGAGGLFRLVWGDRRAAKAGDDAIGLSARTPTTTRFRTR
jgi:hypothetical protein